jgi:hypothetical protein
LCLWIEPVASTSDNNKITNMRMQKSNKKNVENAMQDRWFKTGLAVVCLALCVPAFATTYTVTDPTGATGCTLEQAIQAISTRESLIKDSSNTTMWISTAPADTDEVICAAGDGTDTINLKASEQTGGTWTQPVYVLTGELDLGDPDPSQVTIQLSRGVFDKTVYPNTIIQAPANDRAFFVHAGSSLTLKSITLQGGDVTAQTENPTATLPTLPTSVNGGVVYSEGGITLSDGSEITGGTAQNGGGIYFAGTAGLSLSLTNALINDNTATANGGGVGVDPALASLVISGSQFNIFGNTAQNGGGIYLGSQSGSLTLSSGTLYGNTATTEGAAIDLLAGQTVGTSQNVSFNNITVAGNTGTAALQFHDLCQGSPCAYGPGSNPALFYNSVVVGNSGYGCAIAFDPSNTTSLFDQYLLNVYSVTGDGGASGQNGCPVAQESMIPGNASSQPSGPGDPVNTATFSVLTGSDGNPCSGSSCTPINFGEQHYSLEGFLPTGFDAAAPSYPTLVNAGSPADETTFLCASTDERSSSRNDDCDVGAVELTIASGVTDDIDNIATGQTTWLDVVKNDLGDETIDCTKTPNPCITFLLLPEYGGTVTVVYAPSALPNNPDGSAVYSTTTDPGVVATADATHTYPLVQYVSASGFHGLDQFLYAVPTEVLSGASYAGLPLHAQVSLSVAPKDDFKSKNITDYSGGVGLWGLLFLLCLALLRGIRKPVKGWRMNRAGLPKTGRQKNGAAHGRGVGGAFLFVLATLAFAGTAQADITVNVDDGMIGTVVDGVTVAAANVDPGVVNDGLCSLREALQRSFDNYPIANSDCAPGAHGTDTIILPAGTITLRSPDGDLSVGPDNSVVLQGQGVDKTTIDGAGSYRISTQSYLELQYLTFQNGAAASALPGQGQQGGAIFTNNDLVLDHVALLNNTATSAGGAIFLNFGSNVTHSLSVTSSYFSGNQSANGGVISTVGQSQQLSLSIYGSTFDSNSATGRGGVLDANLATGGTLSVVNSVLSNNSAGSGASGIDLLNAALSTTVTLINDTFYNNTGGNFLDVGNNTSNVKMSNSIIAGTQIDCSSSSGHLNLDTYNLFASTPAPGAVPATCAPATNATFASMSDVTTALGALVPATGSTSDYIPPLFKVTSAASIIVDQGNPAGLVSGIVSPSSCRAVDMRGKSRQSWGDPANNVPTPTLGPCDLGAFEVQALTTLDDVATTSASGSDIASIARTARANILSNDLPSDDAWLENKISVCVGGTLTPITSLTNSTIDLSLLGGTCTVNGTATPMDVVPAPAGILGTNTLQWVSMASGDPVCTTGGDTYKSGPVGSTTIDTTGCGLLVKLPVTDSDITGALSYSGSDPDALSEKSQVCPDSSTPVIKIPYVAMDTPAGKQGVGTLSVTLADIPPQAEQSTITVHTKPDEPVQIPISVTDPDGHLWDPTQDTDGSGNDPTQSAWRPVNTTTTPAAASWQAIGIAQNGDPTFAAVNPANPLPDPNDPSYHPAWGYGVKWNGSTTNPVITYTRGNKTQVFDDTFQVQVRDNCGKTSNITVNVDFPQTDAAGGDLLNGGSLGWGLPLLAIFGLVRRRRKHK